MAGFTVPDLLDAPYDNDFTELDSEHIGILGRQAGWYGVIPGVGGEGAVTWVSGRTFDVLSGSGFIDGALVTWAATGASDLVLDVKYVSGNNRYDLICCNTSGTLVVLKGADNTNASFPATAGYLVLAAIYVDNDTLAANRILPDLRVFVRGSGTGTTTQRNAIQTTIPAGTQLYNSTLGGLGVYKNATDGWATFGPTAWYGSSVAGKALTIQANEANDGALTLATFAGGAGAGGPGLRWYGNGIELARWMSNQIQTFHMQWPYVAWERNSLFLIGGTVNQEASYAGSGVISPLRDFTGLGIAFHGRQEDPGGDHPDPGFQHISFYGTFDGWQAALASTISADATSTATTLSVSDLAPIKTAMDAAQAGQGLVLLLWDDTKVPGVHTPSAGVAGAGPTGKGGHEYVKCTARSGDTGAGTITVVRGYWGTRNVGVTLGALGARKSGDKIYVVNRPADGQRAIKMLDMLTGPDTFSSGAAVSGRGSIVTGHDLALGDSSIYWMSALTLPAGTTLDADGFAGIEGAGRALKLMQSPGGTLGNKGTVLWILGNGTGQTGPFSGTAGNGMIWYNKDSTETSISKFEFRESGAWRSPWMTDASNNPIRPLGGTSGTFKVFSTSFSFTGAPSTLSMVDFGENAIYTGVGTTPAFNLHRVIPTIAFDVTSNAFSGGAIYAAGPKWRTTTAAARIATVYTYSDTSTFDSTGTSDTTRTAAVNGALSSAATTIPYNNDAGTSGLLTNGATGMARIMAEGANTDEVIYYASSTGTTAGNLTGCIRGLFGLTASAHADNAVIRQVPGITQGISFRSTLSVVPTGNLYMGSIYTVYSSLTVDNGGAVGDRRGLYFADASPVGTGKIFRQYGLYIEYLDGAQIDNIGIQNSSTTVYPSFQITVTAGMTLPIPTATVHLLNTNPVSAKTLGTPNIVAGLYDGQMMWYINVGTAAITFTRGAGRLVGLSTATFVLGQYDVIGFIWNAAAGNWLQTGQNLNAIA